MKVTQLQFRGKLTLLEKCWVPLCCKWRTAVHHQSCITMTAYPILRFWASHQFELKKRNILAKIHNYLLWSVVEVKWKQNINTIPWSIKWFDWLYSADYIQILSNNNLCARIRHNFWWKNESAEREMITDKMIQKKQFERIRTDADHKTFYSFASRECCQMKLNKLLN